MSKKTSSPKIFLAQQKILVQNNILVRKKIWSEKNVGPQNFFGPNKERKYGSKKFDPTIKKFGQKIWFET